MVQKPSTARRRYLKMVSISYNFQVAEMGHMNPVHRTRTVLAEGSCRSFELSMFGRPATVRDLKDSVIEHLGEALASVVPYDD